MKKKNNNDNGDKCRNYWKSSFVDYWETSESTLDTVDDRIM